MPALVDLELALIPASKADLVATAALVNAAFATYEFLAGDRTDLAGLIEEAGDDGEFIQASDADGLVATALVRPAATYYGDEALGDALYFGLAGVRPSGMRAGLGRRLVGTAESLAAERGLRRVFLSTLREFGLVPFYESLGYRTFRTEDFEPGHWSVSVPHRFHEMQKTLN